MIDSHCHLDFDDFCSDLDDVLTKCSICGVKSIVIPSVEPAMFSNVKGLCKRQALRQDVKLFYGAGLHPWKVKNYFKSNSSYTLYDAIKTELFDELCVAIGESGLHLHPFKSDNELSRSLATCEEQVKSLRVHLELSQEYSKPVILHSVKAHSELLKYIKQYKKSRGVVHAFSGSYEQAKAFWDLGFYIGVGGVITYERAKKTRDAIKRMPLESLVLETDAPDMPLSGKQGQRNNPYYVVDIAEVLATLKNKSLSSIKEQTTKNTSLLFQM